MSKCYIVVEGPTDEAALRQILEPEVSSAQLEFRVAGGWSAADSLARSLLASGRGDVAVVVAADSVDPNLVDERKRFLDRSLNDIHGPGKWRVIVIEPELEALFFTHKDLLEGLVGRSVSDTDFVSGYYHPRKTLTTLLGGDRRMQVFRDKLPAMDLQRIRDLTPISELRAFISRVAQTNGKSLDLPREVLTVAP